MPGSQEVDQSTNGSLTEVLREAQTSLAMILGFGRLLAVRSSSPEHIRYMADEIQQAARRIAVLIKELPDAPSDGGPVSAEAAASFGEQAADVDRLLLRAEQAAASNATLEADLAEARLAQQQLQSYADDFRRTYAESRQLLHQMTTLYEVSSAIGATVDPDEVLARTTEGLRRLLPGHSLAIYLLDDDEQSAQRQAFYSPTDMDEPPQTVAVNGGPLGRSLTTGHAVLEGAGTRVSGRGDRSWTLALPLSVGSKRLGAVLVSRKGPPFADDDRHLAELVVSQTAMALQNSRLATTDPLTGLYNRRYFEKALAFECDRAHRVGRPLGLLIMDIDQFKRYNERFGHPAGDQVLRQVASTLSSQLRRTDIVSRLGGEEFAAILPEDSRDAVAAAAERLRHAVVQHSAPVFEGQELPSVRVSVGGVSLPGDKASPQALIDAADRALRQAKRRGRNRSVVVGDGGERL